MAIDNIIVISDMEGRYATSTNKYSNEKFNSFVTQEQYDLLIGILGAGLYNIYSADNLNADWLALLNGGTYVDLSGYAQNWQGLNYLMKPFIQSKWIESDHLKALQSALARPELENATVATDYERKDYDYKRWNQFIDRYNECRRFLYTKNSNDSTVYTDFWIHFRPKFKDGIVTKSNIT